MIAIDRFDYRLEMAKEKTGAVPLNYETVDVQSALKDLTAGRGPDACIDAVGMEAHSDFAPIQLYDRIKQAAGGYPASTWARVEILQRADAVLSAKKGGR